MTDGLSVPGIPEPTKVAEGRDHGRVELAPQERTPRATVAVLSRQRASVADHEVGRIGHEALEAARTIRAVKAEADAQVEAAFTVVAIRDGRHVMSVEQRTQLDQIGTQALGRDGRVLEAGPGARAVCQSCRVAGAILTDLSTARPEPLRPR